ncbi:MAG TPA: diacylglycerol kinase [Candidatus Moranbacteria bacterium]|nr:diacylglycerol kinase [Candidatus Moranbacteria bacterium]HAT74954.1 diacylglycerol kinase [Candidatus Moranbacteria bacterium]
MISIIAAVGKNNAIGRNNRLLWNIPEDMVHFKKKTTGHAVIMGDRTYESVGRLLPNRKNIIVSLDKDYKVEGAEVRNDLEKVLNEYKNSDEEVFVIGGGMVYKISLPMADKLYLTLVDDAPAADTFFPDYSEFSNIVSEEKVDNGKHKFNFLELTKK